MSTTVSASCFSIPGVGDACQHLQSLSPDDLIEHGLLGVFGPGLIVCGFILINLLSSWLGVARMTMAVGRGARDRIRVLGQRSYHNDSVPISLMLASLAIALQIAWVYMGYYVGNSIGVLFRTNQDASFPPLNQIPTLLRWDAFAQGFILLNIIGLVAGYTHARRESSLETLSVWLGLPGYLYGFFGLLGGVLNLIALKAGFPPDGDNADAVTYMFVVGFAGVFYVLATRYTFRACAWLRRLWNA